MIKKYSELEINEKTLKEASKLHNITSLKNILNSPKYLVIDWKDANIVDVKNKLKKIDKDVIIDYISDMSNQFVNNDEVLFEMIKYCDKKDPDLLWIYLVDNNIIHNKLYELNSDIENFNILLKFVKTILPK